MSKISKNPNPLHTQQNRFAKHLTYFAKRFMISTVGVSMTVTTDGAKLTPTVARAAVISAFGRVEFWASHGGGRNTPMWTWTWDFGDGTTSNEKRPTHTYAASGTYTVTLTVSNANGSNSIAQNVAVTAPTN